MVPQVCFQYYLLTVTRLISGNYVIIELRAEEIKYLETIGVGGFGTVFRGICRNSQVAIKKIFKQNLSSKDIDDFKREIEVARFFSFNSFQEE